jgi:hypothetical protein
MRFFASGFFHESVSPCPRVLRLDRFDFFRKFAEIFASQGAPPVSTIPVANLPPVSATPAANSYTIFASVFDTGGKFATGVNNTGGKFATGVNDAGGNHQRYRRQICHRCQRHRWQIMATRSGWRHLKVNLKAKIYTYVHSTTQQCPNNIIKIFLLEGFFHLPPVSLTRVANLELRISPRIFEKIRNDPNGIIRGLGETDSRKKPEAKNLVTLSL